MKRKLRGKFGEVPPGLEGEEGGGEVGGAHRDK